MASGFSSRFGENKIIKNYKGYPLISHILKATENLFSETIVVSRYKEVEKICTDFNLKCVIHNKRYKSDTIKIGLENLSNLKLPCAFFPSDQPLLKRSTISNMINAYFQEEDYIVRLAYKEKFSTPVIFPEWAIKELFNLIQDQGGSAVIKKHSDKIKNFYTSFEYELFDIDTKDDLLKQWS